MAKAKKLPSGQWRTLVYDYTDSDKKRHYESFTSDDKKESEYMAAEFALNKKTRGHMCSYTLTEAIDAYINNSDAVLSPTTIQGYRGIQRNHFPDLMNVQIKKLSNDMLQNAINNEAKRPSKRYKVKMATISPKTVINAYGLITAVINKYYPTLDCTARLPSKEHKIKELIPPETIMMLVKGTDIELPVLLAMWLSFSMSELLGLTKSKSVGDGYLTIGEVVVTVGGAQVRKKQAKTFTRARRHKIPRYIQLLIDRLEPTQDRLVTLSGAALSRRFSRIIEKNGLPHMAFHDLRHVNASVMALLRIPDKYALERGGWKTDAVMKSVYTHTFSEEREAVDKIIDNFFEDKMQHEMQHSNKKTP